ncbi:polysaccharide deacetylase family protein [Xanthobacter autotrophicus DSM 431]|uniref:polysaccharide deacetylase family protein n=1 Tax=Xanthobacter nonsaccharivorans TaxID=3119912 RepID=UPI003729483C
MDAPNTDRDFLGYGGHPPAVRWPGGARLAVSVVVNVEEGAELSLGAGDGRNEGVYEVADEVVGARDLCMESHFEYGPRAGWPRIRAVLKRYGVAATLNANGRALALCPWIAREGVADGHEVAAHGWRWETHAHMAEEEERAAIARTVEAITAAAGAPPRGWHTRSATSVNTRRLLREHGGFLYDSNAYNDDLPYLVREDGADSLVLPYAFDTNDMRYSPGGGFVFADDFARYCIDAFDKLYEEGEEAPRMMSVGLHLRIIGRPGRIGGLERFLAHAAGKAGVWFARREDIARHWLVAIGREDLIRRALGADAAKAAR